MLGFCLLGGRIIHDKIVLLGIWVDFWVRHDVNFYKLESECEFMS